MNEKKIEERKKMIYGLLCDELYVPMRTKEIAMLLDIPKSKRQDLQEVLDALVEEGKAQVSKAASTRRQKSGKEGLLSARALALFVWMMRVRTTISRRNMSEMLFMVIRCGSNFCHRLRESAERLRS